MLPWGGEISARVLTDHKSLQYFNTQVHLSWQQSRWVERLSLYQLHIDYKSGSQLVTTDALSRLYVESITGDDKLNPNWRLLYLYPKKVQ